MYRNWIERTAALAAIAALSGCATTQDELLPHGDRTMRDIWQQETAGGARIRQRHEGDARSLRASTERDGHAPAIAGDTYTRTAANEIANLFHRLPNPDLVMYVFPHLVGGESVPVPGYTTVFPFYRRVHYALPGDRREDY